MMMENATPAADAKKSIMSAKIAGLDRRRRLDFLYLVFVVDDELIDVGFLCGMSDLG